MTDTDKIAAIVLNAILCKADGETYGASYARTMNEDRAKEAAERIASLISAQPQEAPKKFAKIRHRGIFIERQGTDATGYRFICHTGIDKFLPDLYDTQEEAIKAVDAKLDASSLSRPERATASAPGVSTPAQRPRE